MHRIFYTDRNDINAVVHTHSTFATVLGTLNEGLPASSYLVAFAGKDVRCGKYASYGTPELAKYTFDAMKDRYAAIMANHGLIAGGEDALAHFADAGAGFARRKLASVRSAPSSLSHDIGTFQRSAPVRH